MLNAKIQLVLISVNVTEAIREMGHFVQVSTVGLFHIRNFPYRYTGNIITDIIGIPTFLTLQLGSN